jgi:PPOX class probable F420-dependent enzyme
MVDAERVDRLLARVSADVRCRLRGLLVPMQPPASHADLLTRPTFAHLATVRADGAPQVNPMWFLWDPDQGLVKMTHTKVRHNYRLLQREPRVALSILDPDRPYRYLQVRGVVERIEDDPTGAFHEALQQRYLGRVGEVPDREARVVLSVRPTAFKTM